VQDGLLTSPSYAGAPLVEVMRPSAAVLPHQEYDRLCAIKQAAVISINALGDPSPPGSYRLVRA